MYYVLHTKKLSSPSFTSDSFPRVSLSNLSLAGKIELCEEKSVNAEG